MSRRTKEHIQAGRHYAKAWSNALCPNSGEYLSEHDMNALVQAFAWALYRQQEGLSPKDPLPKEEAE